MGKGDRRTKRGKIINGSFGKSRPAKRPKPVVIPSNTKNADSASTRKTKTAKKA